MPNGQCPLCGTFIPVWEDISAALTIALESNTVPAGLRPMILQAIKELQEAKETASDRRLP